MSEPKLQELLRRLGERLRDKIDDSTTGQVTFQIQTGGLSGRVRVSIDV